ncbi:MAG: hypothetical protein GY944_00430, partial [bacterium]|nr:hypothetical protein [bacterium]
MGAEEGGSTADNNASNKRKSEGEECREDRQVIRVTRSADALRNRLDAIESGKEPKPDWIHLQAACRLDKLRNEELTATVKRLHRCVLR